MDGFASNITPSSDYGIMQEVVDYLYQDKGIFDTVRKLDVELAAEIFDLPDELLDVVRMLPTGSFTRRQLCDQVNSALNGRVLGQVFGSVS